MPMPIKRITPQRETRAIDVTLYPSIWQVLSDRATVLGLTTEQYIQNCIALDVHLGWRDSTLTYPHSAASDPRR